MVELRRIRVRTCGLFHFRMAHGRGAVVSALTTLDKGAVGATAAAAAFNVLLWSVGETLNGDAVWLPVVRWLFALVSFVAFDLVVLAVVADQRAHGRRKLGTATMACAAVLSGGVALHVAGVIAAPELHAGPAALLFLLGLHLSDIRVTPADSAAAPPDSAPLQVTQAVQVNVSPALSATPHVLSKTAKVAQLAAQHGVSTTTMWRKVKAGEVEV